MLSKDERGRKSSVYWIRLPDHDDIFSQGYVGFSSLGIEKRFNEHLFDARNKETTYPIHRAIRKYGKEGLIIDTVCIGSADYCLELERKLRPDRNLGWNICAGGGAPGLGRVLSSEHKEAVSRAQKGRVRTIAERHNIGLAAKGRFPSEEVRKKLSDAAKARGFADSHKENISKAKKGVASTNPMWMHPSADRGKWAVACHYYDLYKNGFGRIPSSEMLGYNGDAFKQILKRIKDGWNPWKDEKYMDWRKSQIGAM